ncbi:MAG: hypothetical protein WBB19_03065 [Desulforhopalus sp.]
MKKIIASAVGLMLAGGVAATTASAVESQFGGYWRTRMFVQSDFTGQDNSDFSRTDNRTRLYYTAKFNDDFKFVNKFEFNSNWGDTNGGDIGADGDTFRVKNSYADFTLGMANIKLGIQGARIARGFLFDDDFSGAVVTGKFGAVTVPVLYAMVDSEDVNPETTTNTVVAAGTPPVPTVATTTTGVTGDTHLISVMPSFNAGDAVKVTPHVTYLTTTSEDTDIYWLGVDADAKFDAFSAWGTFIYNGGELMGDDISGFLVAAGADAGIVHGQAFYASGDDDAADNDIDAFLSTPGQSYYWSEIMGLGTFDNRASAGSPGDDPTNIWAVNAGVTVKPMDKLTFDFDVWYAQLAEEVANEDELGIEFDAKLTYAIYDNLKAEFVFAYLLAGDATGGGDEDPMEAGVRISLGF